MTRLELGDELTIVTAAETRERLVPYRKAGTGLELDLSAVSDVDTAGLQLLLAARREGVVLTDPSPVVRDLLDFTRLSAELR
ncbi:STAS domain-containing protein [Cryptosporangium arvum]|uniref:STAS domain-containing protein n=1 Tax=Cryptosporangium arvum TaxID=80871 RepID=UPI0004B4977F|nr:STAS domain-containing protein [Cryptosporangium arvum]